MKESWGGRRTKEKVGKAREKSIGDEGRQEGLQHSKQKGEIKWKDGSEKNVPVRVGWGCVVVHREKEGERGGEEEDE